MSGKNLTFKLIMDGDSKGLVAAAKQSETVTKKVFENIKTEAQKVQIDGLIEELNQATKEISGLGDKSVVSASQIREMSMKSQQMVGALKSELVGAQAELVRLSQSKAAPAEITKATNLVAELKASILSVEASFGAFESTAKDAMSGVDRAASKTIAEVQKFTSVDLTELVSEAQNASRAIESMGNGAVVSTKDVERMGQLGATAINSLEQELLGAQNAFSDLSKSTDAVSLKEFNAATAKVNGLEGALSLAKRSFSQFESTANAASQNVANNANKLSTSAKKAGSDIYAALGIRPPTVINDAITDLSKKLENFKKNSKLPAEEIARVTKITEQEIARLKSELSGVDASANSANTGVDKLSKGMGVAKYAATVLAGAMAALGVGLGIRELAQTADTYTNLSARINIATKEGGDFTSAMAGVHQVALMTNSSLDATGSLFTRLNAVGKDMGMTQQQALDLTKTVTQAIQIGGGSAQASEAAVQQFIQAMQGGVLRGEEFNSIMENGFGVAEALARGLGVTTGELRKMAENGELSAERVVKALQGQASEVQKTYEQFPTTITNALTKISTQWQILIGEMDQANGASATVANALSIIADNLGVLKVFFDDVSEGVGYLTSKFNDIDPSTLDALRNTLTQVYDTVKTLVSSIAGIAETAWSAFTSTLDAIAPLFNAILNGKDEVSGITTLFNVFKIALGVVSDAATGLNIALKLLLAGVQFITGGIFALNSAVLDFLGFDDLAAQAQNASDALFRQAEKNASEANRLALESNSATREAIKDITQTEEDANKERIANSKKTLEELQAQEEKHKSDYRAISDERIKLNQQLEDARKSGNQSTIDAAVAGLAELDSKEKAYQAQSQKITQQKIEAAQAIANATIQSADAAGVAQLQVINAQLAVQGLQAEFDSAGKVVVKAMTDAVTATEAQVNATDKARKAATALGIDLDVSLNRISEKFKEGGGNVEAFVTGLDGLGIVGQQAAEVIYQAWQKWTTEAKSQAELDASKAKLVEFGEQGKLSTSQVEMGLQAIKRASQELPAALSPAEAAMERLGIKSKEQLKLAAENALTDLDTVIKSGEATQEGLQKAYEETVRLAQASGNTQVMAAANAKAAYLGLEVQLDATGKATVTKLGEIQQAAVATQRTVSQVGQSSVTSSTQPEISPEQQATNDHWDDFKAKMKARTDAMNAKSQARGSGGGVGSLLSGNSQLAQQIPVAPEAPLIASSFDIEGIETMQPTEKKILEIQSGGKSAELQGTPEAVDGMEDILREFEMLKRSM